MSAEIGFVLRLNKLKEADAIVSIYGPEGIREVYAHSVFTAKSTRRAKLEILNLIKYNTTKSKAQLPNLAEVSIVSDFKVVKSGASGYAECFILAEILQKFLTQVEEPEHLLFEQLASISQLPGLQETSTISQNDGLAKKLLAYITLVLLDELGFLPELNVCQISQQKFAETDLITPAAAQPGYVISSSGSSGLIRQIKVQEFIRRQKNVVQFLHIDISQELLASLLKTQIDWIEITLGQKLKSNGY